MAEERDLDRAQERAGVYRMRKDEQKMREQQPDEQSDFRKKSLAEEKRQDDELTLP